MTVAVNVETFHLTAKINLLVAQKETPDANKCLTDLFSGNRDCRRQTIFARPSATEWDILRQIGLACEVTHRRADRIQSEEQNFRFWSSFRNRERHRLRNQNYNNRQSARWTTRLPSRKTTYIFANEVNNS